MAGIAREHARQRPDRLAIRYGGLERTFGELNERAGRLAAALDADGVDRDDRVAIYDKNGPEFFDVLFGAAQLGAVTVAVNWRLAPPEIAYIINDAEVKVLVVGPEFAPVIDSMRDELTTVKRVVQTGGEFEAWLADAPDRADDLVATSDDDVIVQMYTSGTTGLPKGVMLSNRNLLFALGQLRTRLQLDDESVVQVVMPLFHIAGSGWALVGLLGGVPIVLHRELDPVAVVQSLERDGVTHALYVPAVLQFLLTVPDLNTTDLSALRQVVYGASPIAAEVLTRAIRAFGCGFSQAYGLTETTGGVVLLEANDHDPDGPRAHLLRSAGRALDGAEVRVVDAEGNDVALGTVGEVLIRSPQVMRGYWRQPEATAAAIDADGWFRSGDAGYFDADGYLFIHDRVKDMIVSGGENVYPAEVENVLMAHPALADAAVIGVPDDRWGETVKAVLVRAADASDVTDDEIIDYCRQRLAGFKCPTSIDWTDALPRNPSGKILKKDLREPYWVGRQRQVN
jgi:long-chain acyl-CoA synthetase